MNIQTHHELKCREKPVAIFFSFVFFLLFQKRRTHKNKTIITYESNNEIGEAPTATTKKFSLIFSCSFSTFFLFPIHIVFFSLHNVFIEKKIKSRRRPPTMENCCGMRKMPWPFELQKKKKKNIDD